jgi:hypothetical protein
MIRVDRIAAAGASFARRSPRRYGVALTSLDAVALERLEDVIKAPPPAP